ncbi:hypothetical protein KK083_03850 [Fulvivirgaceae bacterium PWU4]|uniref:DUF4835 family protein n=1 Tax=Chryseosolibacter histidini TaxID=2782349 RepID=A0AAP2DGX0_9BACT|nr:hypothetical protein [Chryseosolibacter histidini]MBT1695996.1 hypothetical protein [Chryseosolibacter histidini]
MKVLLLLPLLVMCGHAASAQSTEFTIHSNGLIYNEQTMNRLSHIVDSMHIRFRNCEPHEYKALAQGPATYFHLNTNLSQAREAIDNNITPEAFLTRFPEATMEKLPWIAKDGYRDYEDVRFVQYFSMPLQNDEEFELDIPYHSSQDKIKGWVYQQDDDGLSALYLDLEEQPLPFSYAHLVQYVDCMIDSTATLYLTRASDMDHEQQDQGTKASEFLSFANNFEGMPKEPDYDWDKERESRVKYRKYQKQYEEWDQKRLQALDLKMKADPVHLGLLRSAVQEAISGRRANPALEFYVERYLSPVQALQMKRLRRVMGLCSMDRAPRLHAVSICRLAAETAQWDIFLRAHLDIMNDNFSRATDGSYAWAGRGTYLKELEALNIQATDLLLGTCLLASNTGDNHYYGDIGRIGRALAETGNKTALENRLLSMIQDPTLDRYNRLRMAYLFDNYNYHLKDEGRKKNNIENFLKAVDSLPDKIGASFRK